MKEYGKKRFDVLYVAMFMTVLGQCIVGNMFYVGQGLFLTANVIYLTRDFKLNRPKADKIKNTLFTAITVGIIVMQLIASK